MKKYELLKEEGTYLSRIRALINIPDIEIRAGYLGGLVKNEWSLDHKGNCWIYKNAKVYGNAIVSLNTHKLIFEDIL